MSDPPNKFVWNADVSQIGEFCGFDDEGNEMHIGDRVVELNADGSLSVYCLGFEDGLPEELMEEL